MRRWFPAKTLNYTPRPVRSHSRRCLSIIAAGPRDVDVERVSVRCASSGSIYVDLYNNAKVPSSEPLLIYLPPYSATVSGSGTTSPAEPPRFCQGRPTAVVHYRWAGYSPFQEEEGDAGATPLQTEPADAESMAAEEGEAEAAAKAARAGRLGFRAVETPLHWPTPIHDALQAYGWILGNLAPPLLERRDVYVCGSYLGASLAAALALTEAHPHQRMAVRGCVAFNGVYNWTTFLPDHPIHRPPKTRKKSQAPNVLQDILLKDQLLRGQPVQQLHQLPEPRLLELKQHATELFERPGNLFDPFASPCLFFHTPNLHVPRTFDKPAAEDWASSTPPTSPSSSSLPLSDFLAAQDLTLEALLNRSMAAQAPPRKSPLAFPPRKSTLKIPRTLLLHTTPPPPPPSLRRRQWRRSKKAPAANSFKAQADALAAAMRRSVTKIELRDRLLWDEDLEEENEVARRVQVHDVGLGRGGGGGVEDEGEGEAEGGARFGLSGEGNRIAEAWLEDRLER